MADSTDIELNKVNEEEVNSTRTIWQMTQNVFNWLNHISIIIVTIYMTCLCVNAGNAAISWHAFLCTIGYQLLMAQGILAFYRENDLTKKFARKQKRTLHWVLQVMGSLAAIVGMITEYVGRESRGGSHFKSWHSIFGLLSGVLALISLISGISALWSIELKKCLRPIYNKLAHNLIGIVTFGLGMTALYLGYDKKFMIKNSSSDIRTFLQILAIITIILSLVGALRSLLHQIHVACSK